MPIIRAQEVSVVFIALTLPRVPARPQAGIGIVSRPFCLSPLA